MKKLIIICLLILALTSSVQDNEWIIYPNPATTYFNIEAKTGFLPPYLKVHDMNGSVVKSEFLGNGITFVRIPIDLKPGAYIVNLYLTNN